VLWHLFIEATVYCQYARKLLIYNEWTTTAILVHPELGMQPHPPAKALLGKIDEIWAKLVRFGQI